MSFENKWRNYQRIVEAVEPTPFKSPAQKRYKAQRKRNDVYSQPSGAKNPTKSDPFSGKAKRAGTDRLRFEEGLNEADQEVLDSFTPQETLNPDAFDGDVRGRCDDPRDKRATA